MEHETVQLLQATADTAADSIDICDLEYDVAGVGAAEPSHAEDNQAAYYLFHYRALDQK